MVLYTFLYILLSLFIIVMPLCFRCDLGFWDVCYTTKTNCSYEEQCFVGIGKAASVLDIKVMGCLPVKDCNKTTTIEFSSNKTLYTMTKNCCEEDYCNGSPGALSALTTAPKHHNYKTFITVCI
uniref:UPAR/Ly6 domain-containing protein n=1 Tax=Astyanax mexicanus TaxID=7994 RepID=W5JY11_ASTMX